MRLHRNAITLPPCATLGPARDDRVRLLHTLPPTRPDKHTHTHPDQWRRRAWYRASGLRAIGAGFSARIGQSKPLLWHAFLVAEKAAAKTRVKLMEKKAATEDKRKQEQKYDEIYSETKRRRMSFWMLSELERRLRKFRNPLPQHAPVASMSKGTAAVDPAVAWSATPTVPTTRTRPRPRSPHLTHQTHHRHRAVSQRYCLRLTHPMSLPTMRPATVTPETDSSDEFTHDEAG